MDNLTVQRLVSALRAFVRMDDKSEEIGGGEWNAAVVMARAAIAEATDNNDGVINDD